MADRKAVNKYYPPDWRPEMGSLNSYHGTHALRERARKLDQGILIIRFEMPYNIWCDGCGNHVGMGVRYNAEKKKVGNYYSTPIFRFRMKCHLCENRIEMETDPKNCDYTVVRGASRKNERWEGSEGSISVDSKIEKEKLNTNAMYKLEHDIEDAEAGEQAAPSIEKLERVKDVWKDDYSANKRLRDRFRQDKATMKQQTMKDDELRKRLSIELPLSNESNEDKEVASKIKFFNKDGFAESKRKRRCEIKSEPLLDVAKQKLLAADGRSQKLNLIDKKIKLNLDHRNFKPIVKNHVIDTRFDKSSLQDVTSSLIKRKQEIPVDKDSVEHDFESSTGTVVRNSNKNCSETTSTMLVAYDSDSNSSSS